MQAMRMVMLTMACEVEAAGWGNAAGLIWSFLRVSSNLKRNGRLAQHGPPTLQALKQKKRK
jgi:hypothetical protein